MTIRDIDVTDANGIRVIGTVEVGRDPAGPYYDPNSPYYQNDRYAEGQFEFLTTREVCTIDRQTLANAMQEAFADALTGFGITGPDQQRLQDDVGTTIDGIRQQCIENQDKYVSNEVSLAADWETRERVGDVTAKAYEEITLAGGGTQVVLSTEGTLGE